MEFIIPKDVLVRGIRRTLGITEKKTTLPILNNVLIKAKKDGIVTCATDLEITLIARLEAQVVEEGEFTISARKLYDFVRVAPEGMVTIKGNPGGMVSISSEKVLCRMPTVSVDDFPVVEEEVASLLYEINPIYLIKMIDKTVFAISQDEARPALSGGFLEVEGNILKMVGTDGYRMALLGVAMEKPLPLEKGIIIPRAGLLEMRKILEEGGGDSPWLMGIEKNFFVLKSDKVFFKANLIGGDFPDYRRILKQEEGNCILCDREELMMALERVNVISSEGYGGVILNVASDYVILSADDTRWGNAQAEINIDYGGEPFTVGYNINYLLSVIEAVDEREVILEIRKEARPTFVKGKGNESFLGVVMPLKM